MIYFAQQDGGPIKIGYTRNVRQRMHSLRAASAKPVVVLGVCSGGLAEEKRLHAIVEPHRVRGEWFADCDAVRQIIADHAQPYRIDATPAASEPTGLRLPFDVDREFREALRNDPRTAEELGDASGLTPRSIYNWRTGANSPNFAAFIALGYAIPAVRDLIAKWFGFESCARELATLAQIRRLMASLPEEGELG